MEKMYIKTTFILKMPVIFSCLNASLLSLAALCFISLSSLKV